MEIYENGRLVKKDNKKNVKKDGVKITGTIYGNVSNASTLYGEEKFHASRGHGFAAERANTLYDKITGHDAVIVGDDNVKNGADRLVDGINIQSKYCKTGSKCIQECFENGKYRYMNTDGTPMKVEVPSDKYDSALQAMKNRIAKGEVQGVTDPNEAENIVCKGRFTYEQVKNITKAGTIESLTYDAVNGSIVATTTFGITAVVSFATSIWNGEDAEIALKNASLDGLKVAGTTFATAVLAGQLTKAGMNSLLVGSTEGIVKFLGPKGSAVLANAFRGGKNIYGAAAMTNTAKMLRTNTITAVASIVVLSAGDVINIFRGRISGRQLFKNVTNTTAGVAGGSAGLIGGAAAGATIGSFILPGVGTTIGGVVGGIFGTFRGGSVASKKTKELLDKFMEDDADEMVSIMENVFVELATDYLLTQKEVEQTVELIGGSITQGLLKDMYASDNRKEFAKQLLTPLVEIVISQRKHIPELTLNEMQSGLKLLLEEIADNEEYQNSYA